MWVVGLAVYQHIMLKRLIFNLHVIKQEDTSKDTFSDCQRISTTMKSLGALLSYMMKWRPVHDNVVIIVSPVIIVI